MPIYNINSQPFSDTNESSRLTYYTDCTHRIFVESEFAPLRTVVLTQSMSGDGNFDNNQSNIEKENLDPPSPINQIRFQSEREAFGLL